MTPGSTVMRWLGISTSMIRFSFESTDEHALGVGEGAAGESCAVPARDERNIVGVAVAHDLLYFRGSFWQHDAARVGLQTRETIGFVGEQFVGIAEDPRRADDPLEAVNDVAAQHEFRWLAVW